MHPIYLDYAAATPIDEQVLAVMKPYFADIFYNPSALYVGAREAKQALEESRAAVARCIGARPSEITFTAGGTESANLAITGVMEQFPDAELLVSAVEHDAVLKPADKHGAKIIPVDPTGRIDVGALSALVNDKTVLISVMYANNEVGTVQPIDEIVSLVAEVRRQRKQAGNELPLYVHTDACQAPLYLSVNVGKMPVDLMTLNGGKIYGPKQSGVLYHRTGVVIKPQILGGGQELGLRSGTENVAACVGFAQALENAVGQRTKAAKAVKSLTDYFIDQLEARFGAEMNGHPMYRLPNNVHVTFPGKDNERILFSLDEQGVYAASGSACSASSDTSSHVLLAMGKSDEEARASLRFTLGKSSTKAEIDRTLEAIEIALTA